MNFAKFVRTPFLQNTTGRLLLIIAVSVVVKRLANETVDYNTKTKAYVRKCSPGERTCFRSSCSQTSN